MWPGDHLLHSSLINFVTFFSVSMKKTEEAVSVVDHTPRNEEDEEESTVKDVAAEATDVADAVSWEVEGRNSMVEEEPYMNLVQWLVVNEAGVGLKGAKVTIGTGGGKSSVVVAHLTTDKNGIATIRLPWAA
jgi:hypothetical protein